MQQQRTAQNSGKLGWGVAAVMTIIALGQCSKEEATDDLGSPMFVQAASLNCRSGASQADGVVRSLGHNDTVQVLEVASDWSRVDGTPSCWVASRFLSSGQAETVETASTQPAPVNTFMSSHERPSSASRYREPAYEPPAIEEPVQSTYSGGGSVYYANCSAARAAGAAPVRVGDPGYASKLDRDGDGVGCE